MKIVLDPWLIASNQYLRSMYQEPIPMLRYNHPKKAANPAILPLQHIHVVQAIVD